MILKKACLKIKRYLVQVCDEGVEMAFLKHLVILIMSLKWWCAQMTQQEYFIFKKLVTMLGYG